MKISRVFQPLLWLFVFFTTLVVIFRGFLEQHGVDHEVILVSNFLLFGLSALGFFLQRSGLRSPNPHAFVRSVYLSMILKLLVCMIAVVVYISFVGNEVNKPALFISMALYLVYTTIEVMALMKSAAKKNG